MLKDPSLTDLRLGFILLQADLENRAIRYIVHKEVSQRGHLPIQARLWKETQRQLQLTQVSSRCPRQLIDYKIPQQMVGETYQKFIDLQAV